PRPVSQAAPPLMPFVQKGEPEVENTARLIDLPPIPLVEVDEPMVLEGRDYAPPPKEPLPPPATARVAPPPAIAFTELEPESLFEETMIDPDPIPAPRYAPEASAPTLPPPPAKAAAAPAAEIETPTMAEIYANQGHFDQALAVYRRLIERQPNESKYRERVDELVMLARGAQRPGRAAAADSFDARERTLRVLEDWLEAIRRSRGA
ncbi:MAG: hypothetical protein ACRD21_04225, partial [Vicinamibacteria bacterium]